MKPLEHALTTCLLLLSLVGHAQSPHYMRSTYPERTSFLGFQKIVESSDNGFIALLLGNPVRQLMKLDAAGDPLWAKSYPIGVNDTAWALYEMVATQDGGALLVQKVYTTGTGPEDHHAVLTRIAGNGNIAWSKHYRTNVGLENIGVQPRLVAHANGEFTFAFVGDQSGSSNLITRLAANGQVQWSRIQSPFQITWDMRHELLPSLDNSLTIVSHTGYGYEGMIAVTRIDEFGSFTWGTTVQMTNVEWEYSEATALVTNTGAVYVGGTQDYVVGPISFGFMTRFDPVGQLDWYRLYGQSFNSTSIGRPGRELGNGVLQFGIRGREYFAPDGTHLGRGTREFPVWSAGGNEYSLEDERLNSNSNDLLISGNFRKRDELFNYTWYTPTVGHVPWNTTECAWVADTSYALADTLVPVAFLSIGTTAVVQPVGILVSDTSTHAEPEAFDPFFNFCTLVGLEENNAHNQPMLEVFPSLVTAGEAVNIRSSSAAEVTILDARGRIVWRGRINADLNAIPTNGLAPGLHVVQAVDQRGEVCAVRFVVE